MILRTSKSHFLFIIYLRGRETLRARESALAREQESSHLLVNSANVYSFPDAVIKSQNSGVAEAQLLDPLSPPPKVRISRKLE